ncbi:hypothetical protein DB30_05347 [Enhygromyxa salina]|uniref:Uncharacterized protein n=1 Tax=Enhygromyxa salina TaxID=215803 RepID=A0A0C2D6X8_9BACT|nr:hypothetical protein DB30_05347 [Enhygromyxa salina]
MICDRASDFFCTAARTLADIGRDDDTTPIAALELLDARASLVVVADCTSAWVRLVARAETRSVPTANRSTNATASSREASPALQPVPTSVVERDARSPASPCITDAAVLRPL